MAGKKDKKSKKSKSKKAQRGNLSFKGRMFLIGVVLVGLAFLPTSMLLFIGMLPSVIAFFISAGGRGARASTVSAMNLAGCIPFIIKLWSSGNDFDTSIDIISGHNAIFVMYTAAAFGYMIDWVVTGFVSSFLYQKGMLRMKAIKKRQQSLIDQWGRDVASGLAVSEKGDKE